MGMEYKVVRNVSFCNNVSRPTDFLLAKNVKNVIPRGNHFSLAKNFMNVVGLNWHYEYEHSWRQLAKNSIMLGTKIEFSTTRESFFFPPKQKFDFTWQKGRKLGHIYIRGLELKSILKLDNTSVVH